MYLCLCMCVGHNWVSGRARGLGETWMKNPLLFFNFFVFFIYMYIFFLLSRWAGNKAWQKMRRGWWLIRWLWTGMAILSLLTHSWGQDTEGMSRQQRGKHPQVSPSSVNCNCTATRTLVIWKRQFLLMWEHYFLAKMSLLAKCGFIFCIYS